MARISRTVTPNSADALAAFARSKGIRVLHVAGPRKSEEHAAVEFAQAVLGGLL